MEMFTDMGTVSLAPYLPIALINKIVECEVPLELQVAKLLLTSSS